MKLFCVLFLLFQPVESDTVVKLFSVAQIKELNEAQLKAYNQRAGFARTDKIGLYKIGDAESNGHANVLFDEVSIPGCRAKDGIITHKDDDSFVELHSSAKGKLLRGVIYYKGFRYEVEPLGNYFVMITKIRGI